MKGSVTFLLVAAVRLTETTPFCFVFNSELKENKKNLKKKKKTIKGNDDVVPLPLNQNKTKKTKIPNPSPIQNSIADSR